MSMFQNNDQNAMMSDINVTPLVDVMLVLLTVFIVTAPLLMNAVSVKLPKASAQMAASTPKTLHLSIKENSEVLLEEKVLSIDALTSFLRTSKAKSDPSIEIYADEKAPYGMVAKVMASIQRSGITKFTFVMLPDSN